MKTLAACILSLALLPACATGSDYFVNRGGDLADIFRAHVMVGAGAAVKGEITRAAHIGIGWESNVWAWGLGNREVGAWKESIFEWGLLLGHHDERMIEGLDGNRLSGSYGWTFGEKGGNVFTLGDPNNALDFLTYRITVMLGVGIDIEWRAGEIIDFIAGLFQFDPAGDDRAFSTMKKPE